MCADCFRSGAVHVRRDRHERSRSRHHTDRQLVLLATQPPAVVHRVVQLHVQGTRLVRRACVRAGAGDVPLLFVRATAQGRAGAQAFRGTLAGVQQQAHAVVCRRPGLWRHERLVLAGQHTGRGRRAGHNGTPWRVQCVLSGLLHLHRIHHTPAHFLGRALLPRTEHGQQKYGPVCCSVPLGRVRIDSFQSVLLLGRAVHGFGNNACYGVLCVQDGWWTVAHHRQKRNAEYRC